MPTVVQEITIYFDEQDKDNTGYVANMQCLLNARDIEDCEDDDTEDYEDWRPYIQDEYLILDSQTTDEAITETADRLSYSSWVLEVDNIIVKNPYGLPLPSLKHVIIKGKTLPIVVVDETGTVLRQS